MSVTTPAAASLSLQPQPVSVLLLSYFQSLHHKPGNMCGLVGFAQHMSLKMFHQRKSARWGSAQFKMFISVTDVLQEIIQ